MAKDTTQRLVRTSRILGFSEGLQGCNGQKKKGLRTLNDCKENQRLTSKLPDHVPVRWNKEVTQALEDKDDYPDFAVFLKFVSKEARVACDPIPSFKGLGKCIF